MTPDTTSHNVPTDVNLPKVEIHATDVCNNRCGFCTTGWLNHEKNEQLAHPPRDRIRAQLEEGYRRGARRVLFQGGEPTVRRDLGDLLADAHSIGYQVTTIFTNARMAARKNRHRDALKRRATNADPRKDRIRWKEAATIQQRLKRGLEPVADAHNDRAKHWTAQRSLAEQVGHQGDVARIEQLDLWFHAGVVDHFRHAPDIAGRVDHDRTRLRRQQGEMGR